MRLPDVKRRFLVEHLGEQRTKQIEEALSSAKEELEAAGIGWKGLSRERAAKALAELLVERYQGWGEEDLEPGETGPLVKDEAWDRLLEEKEREIAGLVGWGVLQGRGRGKRLLVHFGSFYDWLREELVALPDWGLAYEVIPDAEVDDGMRGRQRARRATRETFQKAPWAPVVYRSLEVAGRLPAELTEPRSEMDKLVEAQKAVLHDGVREQWRDLRAAEIVLEETKERLGGEDPALPDLRRLVKHTRERLEELHRETETYVGPFELPEPDEELVGRVRELVEREVEAGT